MWQIPPPPFELITVTHADILSEQCIILNDLFLPSKPRRWYPEKVKAVVKSGSHRYNMYYVHIMCKSCGTSI